MDVPKQHKARAPRSVKAYVITCSDSRTEATDDAEGSSARSSPAMDTSRPGRPSSRMIRKGSQRSCPVPRPPEPRWRW